MNVPECDCPAPSQLILCSNTGDMFFKCKKEECYFVEFASERPGVASLDVGQFFPLGTSSLDHYTTLAQCSRNGV